MNLMSLMEYWMEMGPFIAQTVSANLSATEFSPTWKVLTEIETVTMESPIQSLGMETPHKVGCVIYVSIFIYNYKTNATSH